MNDDSLRDIIHVVSTTANRHHEILDGFSRLFQQIYEVDVVDGHMPQRYLLKKRHAIKREIIIWIRKNMNEDEFNSDEIEVLEHIKEIFVKITGLIEALENTGVITIKMIDDLVNLYTRSRDVISKVNAVQRLDI